MLASLLRAAIAGLVVAGAVLAAPADRRQGLMSAKPFVGSPWGDWYKSTDIVQCEPLSITFGGGEGAPYSIAIVEPPASPNVSASDVVVLERVGVLGMPGYTYYSIDGSSLTVGTPVALQITDRAGQVAYSVNRHVAQGKLNEFCHYPGAFWPPSHWDGNHFVIMVLVVVAIAIGFWLGGERFKNFVLEKRNARAARRTERLAGGIALARRGGRQAVATDDGRSEATHVLGEDGDRTSLEDEDRPLLDRESGLPPLPPAYEDAVKPEEVSGADVARDPARADH
ncbi:hypothetical protein JCM10908_001600 [Rhodotorula pacifica]|uniref:uncharacterized protein n=1 Tax=Rhodotorula pacifica TaxID=1495444 RepID=UPI00317A8B62